jgi:2-aminoethylphosphonate-pyruvate transaminase
MTNADTAFDDPRLGEPFLLTPGPLTTAYSVKEAMLRDWGSWDGDFRAMTKSMCDQLVALAGDTKGEFACVPMQGSGSFCCEAMLGSMVPRDGKVLVLANGAYGLRAAETLRVMGRAYTLIDKGDYLPPRGDEVGRALDADPAITHVIAIHCETSSGLWRGRTGRGAYSIRRDGFFGQQMHRRRAGLRLCHRPQISPRGRQGQCPFAKP